MRGPSLSQPKGSKGRRKALRDRLQEVFGDSSELQKPGLSTSKRLLRSDLCLDGTSKRAQGLVGCMLNLGSEAFFNSSLSLGLGLRASHQEVLKPKPCSLHCPA